jgi:hypothetical protein
MSWTVLTFGKHKGRTLPQVLFSDPDWFYYAIGKNFFEGKGKISDEAKELCRKSKSIKIPKKDGEKLEVEYAYYKEKYDSIEIVPSHKPWHRGTLRKNNIDLSAAREWKNYDKKGSKMLVADFKKIKFDNKSYKMTKKRCEEFFEDDDNFDL